jgi:hydroxyacylglutathione hydrolase
MLEIVPLPAFQDNYIWTLRSGKHAAVVDPGEARPVQEYLAKEGLTLVAILATHHHPDHVGGITALVGQNKVPVFGPKGEPIPALTHPVGQGDTAVIPELDASFSVLDIPGHTRAHVAYYGLGSLFCGDTLFACGCGGVRRYARADVAFTYKACRIAR